MLKSASSEKIIEAIRDLSEGGPPVSPSIVQKITLSFNQKDPSVMSASTAVELLTICEREVIELIGKGQMENGCSSIRSKRL